jgi:hypothetical protein
MIWHSTYSYHSSIYPRFALKGTTVNVENEQQTDDNLTERSPLINTICGQICRNRGSKSFNGGILGPNGVINFGRNKTQTKTVVNVWVYLLQQGNTKVDLSTTQSGKPAGKTRRNVTGRLYWRPSSKTASQKSWELNCWKRYCKYCQV